MNDFDIKELNSKLIDYGINEDTLDVNIVKLFNLFLSSNEAYYYNRTYINDLLPEFNKKINRTKQRKRDCTNINKKFQVMSNRKFYVLVDGYFILIPNFGECLLSYSELCNSVRNDKTGLGYLEKIKISVSKYIDSAKLYDIKDNTIYLRVFYEEMNFVYRIENITEEKILKLISEIEYFIESCV